MTATRVVILALLLQWGRPALHAQASPSDSTVNERLVSLGRLWATIQTFHPFFVNQPAWWDSALAVAVPRVQQAGDPAAFASAVGSMLQALRDPVTRVDTQEPSRPGAGEKPHGELLPDSIFLLSIRDYTTLGGADVIDLLGQLGDSMKAARGVVIDLRTDRPGDDPTALEALTAAGIDRLLTDRPLRAPAQRGRRYSGLVPGSGWTSGGYYAGWYTVDGSIVEPADSGKRRSVVFVINQRSLLPPIALALQEAGLGRIVADGTVNDGPAVGSVLMRLSDSVVASVRSTELVHANGVMGFSPDTVVPTGTGGDAPLAVAEALAAGRVELASPRASLAPPHPDMPSSSAAPDERTYPDLPHRLIAGYRMWAVLEFFYPYRDLMPLTPTALLRKYVPRLMAVRDSLEYARAVMEMWAEIHDGHGFVEGPGADAVLGDARPAVRLRSIQGRPLVMELSPDSAARPTGIRVGDEIVAVDGEPAADRMARIRRLQSTSTEQAARSRAAALLLLGRDGTDVTVTVRGVDQHPRRIVMRRDRRYRSTSFGGRTGPIIQTLPGNVGYVDLDRLSPDMVDSMFGVLGRTRAIIFDLRGYPRGTGWAIAPRLAERQEVPAAAFVRMEPTLGDTTGRTSYRFVQSLPPSTGARYRGRTVLLIDERTQSQAEHTGLFLRAANGTVFIGSPTSGADGDVTNFEVPGQILLSFSGQGVSWPSGKQLQRVGLQPDVTVRPTIAGIRAGRDEVLSRALRWVRENVKQ